MIEQVFVPVVAVLTTALACAFGFVRLGWTGRGLATASGRALECVGTAVVFCVLNAAVGAAFILAARAVSGRFVSFYLGADHTLLALSALQALVFQWWRESSRRG